MYTYTYIATSNSNKSIQNWIVLGYKASVTHAFLSTDLPPKLSPLRVVTTRSCHHSELTPLGVDTT